MKGHQPVEERKKNDLPKTEEEKSANEPKIFKIPEDMFLEFANIDHMNEDMFEYVASQLVVQYLQVNCLRIPDTESDLPLSEEARFANVKWDVALEFPEVIPTMGRSKLHEIANFFNLSHHTRGNKKGSAAARKHKHFVLYPKTLFTEKQRQERTRLFKERADIREKYNARDNVGVMPDKP